MSNVFERTTLSASWDAVIPGSNSTYTLKNRFLYSTGLNNSGQLGIGNTTNTSTLTRINSTFKITPNDILVRKIVGNMSNDGSYTFILFLSGNNLFYLGSSYWLLATNTLALIPGQWNDVDAGEYHMAALSTNGALFTAGLDNSGQLGQNAGSSTTLKREVLSGTWSKIVCGTQCTVALSSNGKLFSTGKNNYGQLGNLSISDRYTLGIDYTSASYTDIAANAYASFALSSNGALFGTGWNGCNGLNGFSSDTGEGSWRLRREALSGAWSKIKCAGNYAIALSSNGKLFGWGIDYYTAFNPDRSGLDYYGNWYNLVYAPYRNQSNGTWTDISPGYFSCVALSSNGSYKKIYNSGSNTSNVFGNVNSNNTYGIFNVIEALSGNWNDAFAFRNSTSDKTGVYAISSNGLLFFTGRGTNNEGQNINSGTTNFYTRTAKVDIADNAPRFDRVYPGTNYCYALSTDNSLHTAGTTYNGLTSYVTNLVNFISLDKKFNHLATQNNSTLALSSDGSMYAIGTNSSYQLGLGNNSNPYNIFVPSVSANVITPFNDNIDKISCGYDHTAIIIGDKLYTMGKNYNGQLGLGDTVPRFSFTQIPGSFKDVFCNNDNTFALSSNGLLLGCGRNSNGELGLNNTTSPILSLKVENLSGTWINVFPCQSRTFALSSDNSLHGTGFNNYYQLGLNNQNTTIKFTKEISNRKWKQALGDAYNTYAITTSGQLYTVGGDSSGNQGARNLIFGPYGTKTSWTQEPLSGNWHSLNIAYNTSYYQLNLLALSSSKILYHTLISNAGLKINSLSSTCDKFGKPGGNNIYSRATFLLSASNIYVFTIGADSTEYYTINASVYNAASGFNRLCKSNTDGTYTSAFSITDQGYGYGRGMALSSNGRMFFFGKNNKSNPDTYYSDDFPFLHPIYENTFTSWTEPATATFITDAKYNSSWIRNSGITSYALSGNKMFYFGTSNDGEFGSSLNTAIIQTPINLPQTNNFSSSALYYPMSNALLVFDKNNIYSRGNAFRTGTGNSNSSSTFVTVESAYNLKPINLNSVYPTTAKTYALSGKRILVSGAGRGREFDIDTASSSFNFNKISIGAIRGTRRGANNGSYDGYPSINESFYALSGNKLYVKGDNYFGQLGLGRLDNISNNNIIPNITDWTLLSGDWSDIVCCGSYGFALSSNTTKWFGCGNNSVGQLGGGSSIPSGFVGNFPATITTFTLLNIPSFTRIIKPAEDYFDRYYYYDYWDDFQQVYGGAASTFALSGTKLYVAGLADSYYSVAPFYDGVITNNHIRTTFTAEPLSGDFIDVAYYNSFNYPTNSTSYYSGATNFLAAISANNKVLQAGPFYNFITGSVRQNYYVESLSGDWSKVRLGNLGGNGSMAPYMLALSTNGALFSKGYNYYGQLANNTRTDSPLNLTRTYLSGTFVDIEAGSGASFALSSNNVWLAAGNNDSYKLGLLSSTNRDKIILSPITATLDPINISGKVTSLTANNTIAIARIDSKNYLIGGAPADNSTPSYDTYDRLQYLVNNTIVDSMTGFTYFGYDSLSAFAVGEKYVMALSR